MLGNPGAGGAAGTLLGIIKGGYGVLLGNGTP